MMAFTRWLELKSQALPRTPHAQKLLILGVLLFYQQVDMARPLEAETWKRCSRFVPVCCKTAVTGVCWCRGTGLASGRGSLQVREGVNSPIKRNR